MQQSPENTESECISDPIDRAPSIPSSPMQVRRMIIILAFKISLLCFLLLILLGFYNGGIVHVLVID
jgi:hypothetical protein